MGIRLRVFTPVLALALGLTLPAPATAQWFLAPAVGIDFPAGNLGDLVKSGPIFDVLLGYEVAQQVVVGANGTLSLLPGAELGPGGQKLPDLDLWRLMADVQINLLHPSSTWGLWFGGGIGMAILEAATGTSSTDFSLTLFGDLLYRATNSLQVGASVRGLVYFDGGDEFISIPVELKALIAL